MSNGRSTGFSGASKQDQSRAAIASLELLAADYHAALKPVQDALETIADTPFDDHERWTEALSALAHRLAENELEDVPAILEGGERSDIRFDGEQPENVFARQEFFVAVRAMIADGAPLTAFFATLDQCSVAPRGAEYEVRSALRSLYSAYKKRVGPHYAAPYKRALEVVGGVGYSREYQDIQRGIGLSSDAGEALRDWNECYAGVALGHTAVFRPSQLLWARTIDDQVLRMCVEQPRHLDSELVEALSAVAVGIRECSRLFASLPYLWSDAAAYRRLTGSVVDATTAARDAYSAIDIRLRRIGGPSPMLDILNDMRFLHHRAPLDPARIPGGVNAIITDLFTVAPTLFASVEGKDVIDRLLDQLARVPPLTNSVMASAPPPLAGRESAAVNGGEWDPSSRDIPEISNKLLVPFVPLTSWAEIVAALNEAHGRVVWKNDTGTQEKIKKLNELHGGPIRLGKGRGMQPSVDKAIFLAWWNGLREHFDARKAEEKAKADSAKATTAEVHGYGATGTVVPGIGGSVKKRRKSAEKRKEGER